MFANNKLKWKGVNIVGPLLWRQEIQRVACTAVTHWAVQSSLLLRLTTGEGRLESDSPHPHPNGRRSFLLFFFEVTKTHF